MLGNAAVNSLFAQDIAFADNDLFVVGTSDTGDNGPHHAFLWKYSTGVTTDLGTLGGVDDQSVAYGISSDGTTVVGDSFLASSSTYHAFRWTDTDGMGDLGSLAGPSGDSTAYAVNRDGSVVVGQSENSGGDFVAFRWDQTSGNSGVMSALTDFNDGGSSASAITPSASYIVGWAWHDGEVHAVEWTPTAHCTIWGRCPAVPSRSRPGSATTAPSSSAARARRASTAMPRRPLPIRQTTPGAGPSRPACRTSIRFWRIPAST